MPYLEKSDSASIMPRRRIAAQMGAISSVAAVAVFGGVRPYNAAKAALIAYMAGLSAELAPKRIRANTVSPGTIYFDGSVWQQREREAPEIFKMAFNRNPMGRMGRPRRSPTRRSS